MSMISKARNAMLTLALRTYHAPARMTSMLGLLLQAVVSLLTSREQRTKLPPDKNGPPRWRQAVIAEAGASCRATGFFTRADCSPTCSAFQIPLADRVAASRRFQLRSQSWCSPEHFIRDAGLTRKRTGKCAAPGHLRAPSSGVSCNISDLLFLKALVQRFTREKRCPGVFNLQKARMT